MPKGIERAMLSVIERLIDCLERESEDLAAGRMEQTRGHISTKSRLLFDLNRAIREAGSEPLPQGVTDRLGVLRSALDRNSAAIRANMTAMRELVGMIHASTLRDAADGTYSRPAG